MLKPIFLLGLALQPSLIWAANTFDEVVAATQGLSNVANGVDENIKAVTGMDSAQMVAVDLGNLDVGLQGVYNRTMGVHSSGVGPTEEQLADAFNDFTTDLVDALRDLIDEAPTLNEFGQSPAILAALRAILSDYITLRNAEIDLVQDEEVQNAIAQAGEDGVSTLCEAEGSFGPAEKFRVKRMRIARMKE